ncbi:MAG: SH3 domain-containing protein [Blautia sp.]|nr:SH3 domain-containing protein [Lachnoclostridium sp.]MCM1210518.1 SH3 domain-containing protein [Blautia sp.]
MTKLEALGNWFIKHAKIVMPVVLAVCVIVTVVISVNANKKEAERQEDIEANSTLEETTSDTATVPEVALQENTNPEVGELINAYYAAMASGDIDTIKTLVNHIEDTEVLRIKETSKYVDSYPALEIYTKTGPKENTYLVYVCSELKFSDYEEPLPGMNVYYVCTDENGNYYIHFDDENEDEAELNYIRKVSLQDDVVDLNNKVAAAYKDMVAEDADLAQFILDLKEEIEKNVGGELAQNDEADTTEENPEGTESDEGNGQEGETQSGSVVTKVKAIDVVNIRSSDSETADKLGKAAIGDEFKLLEKIGNGWSKVEYEGKEAYIKSEYLEDIETTTLAEADTPEAGGEEGGGEPAADTASSTEPTGTVTVLETVRIRSSASENSEKLGTAYTGERLELLMKQADGWTKIKYKGQTAYVKSDYVE